jgi:hypothetical protein
MDEKKVYRITFSKSLADYIAGKEYKVEKVRLFLTGTPTDSTKLYAVCKKESLWPLRVTFFKEMAEMWENDSTVIQECLIQRVHGNT